MKVLKDTNQPCSAVLSNRVCFLFPVMTSIATRASDPIKYARFSKEGALSPWCW